jgi:Holliday junction resolvasome RuvABC endonuclease subunit
MKVIGFDVSLNHGAAVELTNGKMTWFSYFTATAGVAKRHENGHRLPPPPVGNDVDKQPYQMERLAWIESWIDKTVLVPRRPDFVGIEDYALRAEQGAHQLGEVGGIARILFWFRGVYFRKHDPVSTKMFVTHDGTAQKDLIEQCVRERWGVDFSDVNAAPPAGKKQNRTSSEDLADAFGIAKLVDAERLIRSGKLRLEDLEHDKERQVFNRTTKTYPVSLIGREWIRNAAGSYVSPDVVRIRLEKQIDRARAHNPKLAAYLEKILKGV